MTLTDPSVSRIASRTSAGPWIMAVSTALAEQQDDDEVDDRELAELAAAEQAQQHEEEQVDRCRRSATIAIDRTSPPRPAAIMPVMLRDIFDHPSATGAAVIAAKAATIYLFLIIGLRWLGKRELGQMSLYDFVRRAPLHPGGGRDDQRGAERGPRAPHEAPLQGVEAPLSLPSPDQRPRPGGAGGQDGDRVRPRRHRAAAPRQAGGEPAQRLRPRDADGPRQCDRLRRQRPSRDELLAAIRAYGLSDLEQVQTAVLEVDGSISVIPYPDNRSVHRPDDRPQHPDETQED
jgi:hypothetical protein